MKENKGITLIALVITIIVLMILAGVSINLLFDSDGIISKAKEAGESYKNAEQNEMNILVSYEDKIQNETKKRSNIGKWNLYRCGWENGKSANWIYTKYY